MQCGAIAHRGSHFRRLRPNCTDRRFQKLWNWLDSRSIVRILNWFDAYDRVDISVKLRLKRWSTPNTERDRLFLQKLGVIPNSSK